MSGTRSRRMPTQARSKATVEVILQASAQVLKREGWARLSTNRVAKVAGVSVGSLYQYFPNKEALLVALVRGHAERQLSTLSEHLIGLQDAPLEQLVPTTVRALLAAHRVDPELHRVVAGEIPPMDALAEIRSVQDHFAALLSMELKRRRHEIREVDIELAVFVLISTVEAITHGAVLRHEQFLDDRLIEETSLLVLRYLER